MRRTGIVLFLTLAALALPALVAARGGQQTASDLILGRWDLTIQGTDAPYQQPHFDPRFQFADPVVAKRQRANRS